MNVLYQSLEYLDVLEQLDDKSYDFIYLDIPYSDCEKHFMEYELTSQNQTSIRHYIWKSQNKKWSDITMEDVEKEGELWEKRGFEKYAQYVAKIIENTQRILKDDGILAVMAPENEHTKINYKLILDQLFSSISNVTISRQVFLERPLYQDRNPSDFNSVLYFCSKIKSFDWPVLKELPPEAKYPERDERGSYKRIYAFRNTGPLKERQYEWHGVVPKDHQHWIYYKDKMDQLYEEGRVIFDNGRVFIKSYRDENLIPVSGVWEYTDNTKLRPPLYYNVHSIDSQSIERMFLMFLELGDRVLCPYDTDGKFSWLADKYELNWTSVCAAHFSDGLELFSDIPKGHYEIVSEMSNPIDRDYQNDIVTSIYEIEDLKEMVAGIKDIQVLVGGSSPEDAIEQIHELVTNSASNFSIEECRPEAQEWISPYWDKLESESQLFLPMGIMLYNQLLDKPGVDMAAAMIEYCKSLERELFKKLFFGYVNDLKDRGINIAENFREAFHCYPTKTFAEFLQKCLKENIDNPDAWRFEFGKMVYVLKRVLNNNPEHTDTLPPIFADFRSYLDNVFEAHFFEINFCLDLDRIKDLRNDCAHPSLINDVEIEEGKNIIREKLLNILENYN